MKTRVMTVDIEPDLRSKTCKSMDNIHHILKFFDEYNIKATFFVVTSLLEKYESEIKEIAQKHEIASHSHTHHWLNPVNARWEIATSKEKLAEYGLRCAGFRAPGFITTNDHLALLKEHGYTYDASFARFFPGRYANLRLPGKPFVKDDMMIFPMPNFVYPAVNAGLSYLKLLHPLPRFFPKPYMFYFHPWEFLEKNNLPREELSTITNLLRRNSGKQAWRILKQYIERTNCRWVSCQEWLRMHPALKEDD